MTTKQAAGLEVVADILETECLLLVRKNCKNRKLVNLLVQRIEGHITAEK